MKGVSGTPQRQMPMLFLQSLAPKNAIPPSSPAEVATLSPDFIKVHQQVAQAEANNLDQLVGMGLRKAIEFLIKDFCISEHPDQKDAIKQTLLGSCIEKFIDDPRIKAVAKRATWLGNDETHYTRKWVDKDVQDLKTLVTLTINYIHSHLESKKFVCDMPDPNK